MRAGAVGYGHMQQIAIDAKTIASVAYNEETGALHVWKRNGRHVIHYNISKGVYNNLVTAGEPDFYYETYIAD